MPAATPMTRLPTALGKRVIPLPAASSVPAPCAARARTALAEWAVQPPVLQRLGQVTALDPGLSRQVGNGPGQLENPVIGPGRQPHSERGLLQPLLLLPGQDPALVQFATAQLAVEDAALELTLPGLENLLRSAER